MIDRSDIGLAAVIAAVFAGGLAAMCAMQLPAASPAKDNLDQLYPGKYARISTLHTVGAETGCGYYQLGGTGRTWRYLEAREGLWAEGLAAKSWDIMPASAGSDRSLAQRWSDCMSASGRGHSMDWLIDPLVVWYVNSKSAAAPRG